MKKAPWLVLVLAASAYAYTVQVNTGDVQVKAVEDAAFLGYDAVFLEGGRGLPVEPGQPALPAVVATVSLPKGTEIASVDVSYADPVVLPGTYRVMPMQEPTPLSSEGAGVTPPDAKVYSSAEPFPGKLVYAFESGNMGGYGVGSVVLAPVQYVPATGKLMVYDVIDFDLRLRRADGDVAYPKVRLEWVDRDIRRNLAASVINPWEIVPPSGVKLLGGTDGGWQDVFPYLIITDTTMAEKAQTLADWKTKKGLKAAVVTTADIETGYTGRDLEEKVRTCIKEYYENKGTQYVCLVGTHAVVPVRKVYDPQYSTVEGDYLIPTDNYYGCLDGDFNADGDNYWGEYEDDNVDWVYDVYVGRIHVASVEALQEVIDKTLCYEGASASSETNPYDYQNRCILAGAWADDLTNLKFMMEYLRDTYLTSTHWTFTELWDETYPGGTGFNSSNFISATNDGHGLIAHMAHCNTKVLGTNSGGVTNSDLYALTNHPKFSAFLYTVGCYPANTDYDDNCAAYFVGSPEGGGVGFAGNTRYGWYSRGDPLNHYSQEFIKEYFNQFAANDVYVAGKLMAYHKHPLQSYNNQAIYRYIYFELIHHGDPDVSIPNDNIGTLNVVYEEEIQTGSQTYEVHVGDAPEGDLEGALVCVWKDDEVYASGTTDASGDVSFDVEPATAGTMYLTASAHNFKTFEADVSVVYSDIALTTFTGRRTEAGIVLSWKVSGAKELSYFNLYRRAVAAAAAPAAGGGVGAGALPAASAKGNAAAAYGSGDGWAKVNAEPIAGRSPYRYLDAGVAAGVYEYKLEAVLRKGPTELGTTRVGGSVPTAFAFEVAPNPASRTARLSINLPAAAGVKVSLYDLAGRKVATVVDRALKAGENTCLLDVSGTAAGVYILRLEAGDRVVAKRVAVIH